MEKEAKKNGRPKKSWKSEAQYWERRYNELKASKIQHDDGADKVVAKQPSSEPTIKKEAVEAPTDAEAPLDNHTQNVKSEMNKAQIHQNESVGQPKSQNPDENSNDDNDEDENLDIDEDEDEEEDNDEETVNKCGECGAVVDESLVCGECGADYN